MDNITLNPGVGGADIATDEVAGKHYQRVKIVLGADGVNAGDVSVGNPVPVSGPLTNIEYRASDAVRTAVAASTTEILLLPANPARRGVAVVNDSETSTLKLGLGSSEVTDDSFTVSVGPGGYFEAPAGFTGEIRGLWNASTGYGRITELI